MTHCFCIQMLILIVLHSTHVQELSLVTILLLSTDALRWSSWPVNQLNLTLETRKCRKLTISKEHHLSNTKIHDNKSWVTLFYFILTDTYKHLLAGNSGNRSLGPTVAHNTFLNMRNAVCHITAFFNPDICFPYCSPTCSQEHWEKRSGQAKNKQVGWFYIYISNGSTHQTKPAFGCWKGPQQRRCGVFARFVFKRQPRRVPAAGKLFTAERHASLQPPQVSSVAGPVAIWAKQQPTFTRLHYWSTRLLQ